MSTITVETTTSEPLTVVGIISEIDPGGNLPEFQFTTIGTADPDPGDWVAGTWTGTWLAADGSGLEAVTPLIGAVGFTVTAGPQTLWIRWVAGTHTPVRRAATIYAN